MYAERNQDQNHGDDLSAFQSNSDTSAQVESGPSMRSNLIVSELILQSGILRFSVTSRRGFESHPSRRGPSIRALG